jgi:hypothetical protein
VTLGDFILLSVSFGSFRAAEVHPGQHKKTGLSARSILIGTPIDPSGSPVMGQFCCFNANSRSAAVSCPKFFLMDASCELVAVAAALAWPVVASP